MGRLTLTDVHKYYGDTHAVKGVSLDIPEGEFSVFVGPSGCGKSTLLRSIAGLEHIDEGTIAIDGEVVNDMRPRDRDIAMVFQNYALYPYMSVFRNIAFGLRARKFDEAHVKRRVADAGRDAGHHGRCWNAFPANCPAVSASAWRSVGRSSGMLAFSCSTSRFPTWMPSSGMRCEVR